MLSILQSIHPKYCELIASGKKTIEVRKTKPRIPTPFRAYIYQTRHPWVYNIFKRFLLPQGKVIGEYLCNRIDDYGYDEHIGYPTPAYEGDPSFKDCGKGYWITSGDLQKTCLSYKELISYGKGKTLHGYHISNLKVYDKPKELSEFYTICEKDGLEQCGKCPYLESYNSSYPCEDGGYDECTVSQEAINSRSSELVLCGGILMGFEFGAMHKCAVCGKKFWITAPEIWAYRTKTKYFCSYTCHRKWQVENEKDQKKYRTII